MPPSGQSNKYQLSIEGMSCQHCIGRVEKAAQSVAGVLHIDVSLENNSATVTGGVPHQVIQALTDAGYPAKPLAEEPESCALADN